MKKDRPTTSYRSTPLKEKLKTATEAEIQETASKFKDVGNHWAKNYIGKLAYLGIISGYGNGMFGTEDTLKVDEFIKMVLKGMGYVVDEDNGYWAEPYIELAKKEGIIEENELTDFRQPIRREEAARIIMKAILKDDYIPPENHYNYVKRKIPDYWSIGDQYRRYVVCSYCYGLITGAENNLFMPKKNLSRAEGSTIIVRALDEYERKPSKPPKEEVITIFNTYRYYSTMVYPASKPEIMDFIKTAKKIVEKNPKTTELMYNSTKDKTEASIIFYEKDNIDDVIRYIAANLTIDMSESSFTSGKRYYQLKIFSDNNEKIKELHMDSIKEVFVTLLGVEANKAMREFEDFIGGDGENKEISINNREIRFQKDKWNTYITEIEVK